MEKDKKMERDGTRKNQEEEKEGGRTSTPINWKVERDKRETSDKRVCICLCTRVYVFMYLCVCVRRKSKTIGQSVCIREKREDSFWKLRGQQFV